MKRVKNRLILALTIIFMLNIIMSAPASAGEAPTLPPSSGTKPGTIVSDELIQNVGTNLQLSKIAQDAIKRGVKPGTFQNVDYTLRQNVELLNNDVVQSIKSNTKGGVVDVTGLTDFVPDERKTYVDKSSGLAFQLLKSTDNKTYMYAADQESIVMDINIPEQTVLLNEANITKINENVRFSVLTPYSTGSTSQESYRIVFNKEYKVPGFDEKGNTVEVKLNGSINIIKPYLDVEYTKHDGYKCVFNAGEQAEVSAKFYADVEKEVKVPLIEFGIPGGDICTAGVGVFLVINVDGTIDMEYSFNQHYDLIAGVKGGTWYYIPTGIDGVLEKSFGFDTDGLKLSAEINAKVYISAEVALKILGKADININAKLGIYLEAKCGYGGNSDLLSIKANGVFSITGRLKIKSFDKKKDLLNYKFPLFNITQEPKSSYVISITEACAYRDSIKGRIEKVTGTDSRTAYVNQPITIRIMGNGNSETLNLETDSNGEFNTFYNLFNGSIVSVKVPETNDTWTEPVKATFPFTNIVIDEADYYDDIVEGYISKDETGTVSYSGPVMIGVLRRENVPITSTEGITVPISNISYEQVNSANGGFRTAIDDLNPYDKVYAYIDYDGFKVYGEWMETGGLDFHVNGNYVQEPDRLSSLGGVIMLGGSYVESKASGSKTNKPGTTNIVTPKPPIIPGLLGNLNKTEPSGEIKYKVRVSCPHGQNPDKVKEREWTLQLNKNEKGIYTAVISPWEMDLKDMQNDIFNPPYDLANYFRLLKGDKSLRYHVYETIEYFYEGKQVYITNEALSCDCERAREGSRFPDMSLLYNYYTPTENKVAFDFEKLLNRVKGINVMLPKVIIDYQEQVVMYKGSTDNTSGSNTRILQGASNFSCKALVKLYASLEDVNPQAFVWNIMVLGNSAKITSGHDSVLLFRDLGQKVALNNELGTAQIVRYDGEDYVPKLNGLDYRLTGQQTVNKTACDLYEKSSAGAVSRIYEWKGKGVPIKIVFENNDLKVEITFSDYVFNQVTSEDIHY